jgi:hypothetical protein
MVKARWKGGRRRLHSPVAERGGAHGLASDARRGNAVQVKGEKGAAVRLSYRGAERGGAGLSKGSCGRRKGKLTSGARLSAAPGGR